MLMTFPLKSRINKNMPVTCSQSALLCVNPPK